CLDALQSRQVAAAQLDALDLDAGERRLAQLAPLEEDVCQRGLVEVAFGHAAVAEDDPLELRDPQPDEVEPAILERDVREGRLREIGPGQPAAAQLRPPGDRAARL